MPRLRVNPGTPGQYEIPLHPGVVTIGRGAACQCRVEHESVSGTHCQLILQGGRLAVKDLQSTNGTFVDGAPVQTAVLTSGQRLRLGSVEMDFIDESPRPQPAAPPPKEEIVPVLPPPRLHIAPHEPAAIMPQAAPSPILVDEYSVPVEGPAYCKYHPRSPAAWMCPQCRLDYCELCVSSRPGGSRSGKFCRRCSGECVARVIHIVPTNILEGNFFAKLPGAFLYPFNGDGIYLLVSGTVFYAVLDFMGSFAPRLRVYLEVIVLGYLFAYLKKIAQASAQGEAENPGWPDLGEIWSDIVLPFTQLLGCFAICLGPALGLMSWIGWGEVLSGTADPWMLGLVALTAVVGAATLPMAVLAVAMFDTLEALNPFVIFPAMLKVPVEYLAVLTVTGAIVMVQIGKLYLLKLAIPIPVAPSLIGSMISFYLMMVEVRMLGLMYRAKRQELGWFARS